jgi:NAD(P)-dependent dehydrogenase (short-subunit alcohol dehydrogenase family)
VQSRVVVVTGASAGVGRATAVEFGRRGDRVALLARGIKGLEAAAREVEQAGGTALPVVTDVAEYDQVEAAAARVEEELGPIDVWVNNAFSAVFAPFTKITMDEFHRTTDVTYLGYVHGTKAALDRMLPRDRGAIVHVGSALAYRGIPLQSAYCGAKHAIQGFYESVRCELLHDRANVHTTMVQLPAVNTPQFDWVLNRLPEHPQPVPPIFQPEVVAKQIVYAADHPQRREYVVGGSAVATIFGNRLAAGVLDRYLAFTGYQSQQTGEPAKAGSPANLWEPADAAEGRDFGAHGSFDESATRFSLQGWLTRTGLSPAIVNLGAAVVAGTKMVAAEPKAFVDALRNKPS